MGHCVYQNAKLHRLHDVALPLFFLLPLMISKAPH